MCKGYSWLSIVGTKSGQSHFEEIFVCLVEIQNVFLQRIYLNQFQFSIFIIASMDLKAFSFTKALKVASQASRWQDTITNLESSRLNPPHIEVVKAELNYFQQRHQLCNMLEFDKNIFYFFTSISTAQTNKQVESNKDKEANKEIGAEFELICYSFAVQSGASNHFNLKGLKGTPSCIGSGVSAYLKQKENIQNTQKVQNNYLYKMVVLIGLQEGFVKVVQFEPIIDNEKERASKKKKEQQKGAQLEKDQPKLQKEQKERQKKKQSHIQGTLPGSKKGSYIKYSVFSDKLQQKPIVSITVAEKYYYEQKNVSFIMFQDNKVFIYNYVSNKVLCIYQPPILSHDHAITFTLHSSGNYFATGSRSGQINIWELTPAVLKAIAHSEDKQLKTKKKQNTEQVEVIQIQHQKEEYVWKFKTKDRIISVFPLTSLHAACVEGLKWIAFMGNLMALISSSGLFRLIAINIQIRDEYITVIEHQIQDGASISGVQIFPEAQCILYFKSCSYVADKTQIEVKDKSGQNQSSTFQDTSERQFLMQNDNYYKTNFKTLKLCKAKQNIIEKLHFGEDLNIRIIKKIQMYEQCQGSAGSKKKDIVRPIRFTSGTVSYYTANQIVMCRNDHGFYIGLLNTEEE